MECISALFIPPTSFDNLTLGTAAKPIKLEMKTRVNAMIVIRRMICPFENMVVNFIWNYCYIFIFKLWKVDTF
jgi:hypothetical protein